MPKRIVIGPYRYLVHSYARMPRGYGDSRGFVKFGPRVIGLYSKLEKGERAEVLMHEISHAVVDAYNVVIPEGHEEPVVDGLSKGIVSVMRANPELLLELHAELTAGNGK